MIKRATVFHFGGNGLGSSRSGKRKRLESERLKIKLDLYNSSWKSTQGVIHLYRVWNSRGKKDKYGSCQLWWPINNMGFVNLASLLLMILAVAFYQWAHKHSPKLTPSKASLGGKIQQKHKQQPMSPTTLHLVFLWCSQKFQDVVESHQKVKLNSPADTVIMFC